MAKVTVTGNVKDITGTADGSPIWFWSPELRDGVMSVQRQDVIPDATTGAFTVQLEEGPAKVRAGGTNYDFTAAAGDLWPLIKVGLAIPPATAAEKLQEAVDDWAANFGDQRYAQASALVGKADLQGGKLNPAQLPDLAVIDYLGPVGSQAAMLALTGQKGDWCTRTDTNVDWIIVGSNPSQLSSWRERPLPAAALTKAVADGAYAPRWQANTAYAQGQMAVLPNGTIGTATNAFTSGASFDATKWTVTSGGGGGASLTDDGTGLFVIGAGSNLTDDGTGLFLIGA